MLQATQAETAAAGLRGDRLMINAVVDTQFVSSALQ
jgi:hypothetical protein